MTRQSAVVALFCMLAFHLVLGEARLFGMLRRLFQASEEGEAESKLPIEYEDFKLSCDPGRGGRYPFIVSIRDKTPLQNHLCGGILIKKNAVLTAAHCIDPRTTRNAVVLPQVHLSGYDLEEPIQILQTVKPFPHPDWTGNIKDGNDLAILKLSNKSCLTPIEGIGNSTKLSNKNTYHFYSFGRSGTAGAFTNLLQYTIMKYVRPAVCQKKYGVTPNETTVCFSSIINEAGICTGDDGSPLTKTPEFLLAYDPEVVGIASYTTGSCDDPGAAVFMNIYSYRKWIKSTLKSKEFKDA